MTNQELFDTVATHLLTQRQKSTKPGSNGAMPQCLYRGERGLKCAIGCLIPDELYDSAMEGAGVSQAQGGGGSEQAAAAQRVLRKILGHENWRLAAELQIVHDIYGPERWTMRLRVVARKYWLSTAVVDQMEARS